MRSCPKLVRAPHAIGGPLVLAIMDGVGLGKGDAALICLSEGNAAVKRESHRHGQLPKVNVGYAHLKGRKR